MPLNLENKCCFPSWRVKGTYLTGNIVNYAFYSAMETCYVLFLNVLIDCLFFSAKRRPIMLTWITEKDFHQADVRQNLLYQDLEVLGGGKRGKALPLNQIFPTLA